MTKPMTAAFKKIQDYRDAVNQGRTKVIAKDLSAVAYLYDSTEGKPSAVAYRGRSRKPAFCYRYETTAQRAEAVAKWMAAQTKVATIRKAPERLLKVGDVLRAVWGYEQTNVDYYMVTKLIGKTMVEISEIGSQRERTDQLQGISIPDKTRIIGKPMRRRAKGDSVKICDVRRATKITPKQVACTEIYSADHWTAYH
jgi:hypothetical protein